MKRILTLIAVAGLATSAFADTTTTSDTPWGGGAEVNANISTGNTDIQTIGAAAEIDYKAMPLNTSLKAGFMRNRTDGIERAKQINASLRTGMNVTNNVDFFALGTFLQNRFRGIDKAWLATPGLGIYPVNNDQVSIRIEGGLGFMNENYFPYMTSRTFTVGTVGMGFRLKLTDVADITNDLMWIEPLKTTDDWRITNTAAISSHMNSVLSLKVSYNTEYRKIPVVGYKTTDNMTTAAVVMKF